MILHALSSYYGRLRDDPEVDVAPLGFSRQKVSFCITLNPDGTLHQIEDLREEAGTNRVPRSLIVPGGAKPSGSGINPGFLWDNTAYMLGFKPEDEKPDRTRNSFEAFRQRHRDNEQEIEDTEFSAVCRFLDQWDPAVSSQQPLLSELTSGFGVFRIRGETHFVHDRDAVKRWWLHQLNTGSRDPPPSGQCLVTGNVAPLARLHEPKIKGVRDAQSSGAAIVSFNLDAFESYRKSQSFNAPVSETAAFQYCTALNHLLRSGSPQRLQIGDATVVYWTERPSPVEGLFGEIFESRPAEDEVRRQELQTLMLRIAKGEYPTELGDHDTPFYVLGLSPNASRVSVRFWNVSSIGELTTALRVHFDDLEMVRNPERDPQFPAAWRLLDETARERKDIPPLLSGALMRAVLTGGSYPQALYSSVIRRIRADREVRYVRAAIIKAHLNRHTRLGIDPLKEKLPMALDPDRPEAAYHLGRLFAELEKTQEDALPGIGDTIKDRYFSAASATPASVFPRIIRLSQHHLGKLPKGSKVYHERRIQAICNRCDAFPSHLSLKDQGLFAIGYYHQRQDIFTKQNDSDTTATTDEE